MRGMCSGSKIRALPRLRVATGTGRDRKREVQAIVLEKANILFITDAFAMGGTERQLLQLVRRLNLREFTPLVAGLRGGELEETFRKLPCKVAVLGGSRDKFSPILTLRLVRWMKENKVDLVHTFLWIANTQGRAAARIAGVPLIISSERGLYPVDFKGQLRLILDRWLSTYTNVVTTNSEAMRRALVERGFDQNKIAVIPNGVDLDEFRDHGRQSQVRQQLCLDEHDPIVGIVARLEPEKDHPTFLRAASLVVGTFPATKFLLVGNGSQRDALEALCSELGLQSSVRFVGLREDVGSLVNLLDVAVLSSTHEAFPNTLLEAMAAGKPVVATSVGGVPELVIDGQTGFLVPPNNSEGLAAAITHLIGDPGLAEDMGRRGRQRAMEFGIESMVSRYETLYRTLLSGA